MSFVAPASPLQQAAFQNAVPALSGWQGQARSAAELVQNVGQRGPNLATLGGPAAAAKGRSGDLAGPAAGTYAQNGTALVFGQGYAAPQLGGAQGYAAARAGAPIRAEAAQAAQYMGQYQNPYQQQVINTTLADFDRNAGQLRAAQAAVAARNGAFGGSRYAIREAQTEGELARARASADANLRSQGFSAAAQLGGLDAARAQEAGLVNANAANQFMLDQAGRSDAANRFGAEAANQFTLAQSGLSADAARFGADAVNRAALTNAGALHDMARFNAGQADAADARALQAAQLLGGMASDHAGNTRADLGLMAQLGEQQRGIEAAYATAPLAQLQAMGQLSGMTPYDILVGRSTSGASTLNGTNVSRSSPSLFNEALAVGNLVASFSERSAKTDIAKVGELPNGLNLYSYRYRTDAPDRAPRIGVMADEVERIAPEAMGPSVGGKRTVYYSKLGLAHLVEE